MEEIRERVSNKLASDRLQFVYQDEPITYEGIGDAIRLGTEQAIQIMYGIDIDGLKTHLKSIDPSLDAVITDASIGVGAPSEGWLIDLYRIVTPKVVEVAAWIVIGQTVYKLIKAAKKYLQDIGYKNTKPMLSVIAVEDLAIKRFMRFRRKKNFYVDDVQLYKGANCGVYESWDMYMISLGRFNSKKTTVLFVDCFGKQRGSVSFKMDRKYSMFAPDEY